jgi:hypothetical protein
VQAAAVAACVIVKVCPAAVIVPVREAVVVFAATVKPAVPFPEPLAPELIVIQLAPLVAVQAHPVPAVTLRLPGPPAAAAASVVGVMV